MTNFQQRGNLVGDNNFRAQVLGALISAATAVAAEDPATDFHRPRRAYAVRVLQNPQSFLSATCLAVAMQPGVKPDGGATDDDILFTVNSLWNAFAVSDDSNPTGAVSAPVGSKLTA